MPSRGIHTAWPFHKSQLYNQNFQWILVAFYAADKHKGSSTSFRSHLFGRQSSVESGFHSSASYNKQLLNCFDVKLDLLFLLVCYLAVSKGNAFIFQIRVAITYDQYALLFFWLHVSRWCLDCEHSVKVRVPLRIRNIRSTLLILTVK